MKAVDATSIISIRETKSRTEPNNHKPPENKKAKQNNRFQKLKEKGKTTTEQELGQRITPHVTNATSHKESTFSQAKMSNTPNLREMNHWGRKKTRSDHEP